LGSFEKFVGFSASGFSLIGPLSRRIRKKISAAKMCASQTSASLTCLTTTCAGHANQGFFSTNPSEPAPHLSRAKKAPANAVLGMLFSASEKRLQAPGLRHLFVFFWETDKTDKYTTCSGL
jgi:hypothetical protein